MAGGGAVYQPTTVTYETGSSAGGGGCGRVPPLVLVSASLCVCALVCTPLGLKLAVDGAQAAGGGAQAAAGGALVLVGVAASAALGALWLRRRGRWAAAKQGLEAGGGAGAALGAPNPSTDPLVTAQYAPVRDAPPADDERRQLMDNKECLSSAEESDRMIESDPRIVLRPLKNADEA